MECRKCGYVMERNLDFRPKYELINNYKKENRSIKSFPICRTISYYIEAYTLINRSFEFHFMKTV